MTGAAARARSPSDVHAAWAELYPVLWPRLVRTLAAAAGSYDGVEDALQEAFAEALGRDPSRLASPEGWVFVVALNQLRRQRRRTAVLRLLALSPPQPARPEDDVLARIDLARSLARLRPRERELLVAKHLLGLTQDEIAEAFGLPRGTVASALSRAAARLRKMEASDGQG